MTQESERPDGATSPEIDIRFKKIAAALSDARRELIDISRRNRLLHSPRGGKRQHCLELQDTEPDNLFAGLRRGGKHYSFAPNSQDRSEADDDSNGGTHSRLPKLKTGLDRETLDRRLLKLFREARAFEEEQGVNVLFMAFGFLKWFEDARSEEPNWAPLILVPVALDRRQGRDTFVLTSRDDDLIVNVSLRERLRANGVYLPDLPEDDDWAPTAYFDAVSTAIASERRWAIDRTSVGLGFFTFTKFLMWRDLDGNTWPDHQKLMGHPLVSALLGETTTIESPAPLADDSESIDKKIDLAKSIHVVNADSSQALAIEEVRGGRNLVVQGPPGTGKSQTIANIIAAAVHDGKSVLFVAEKLAALEVVHDRLKAVGLDPLCLELHSRKATKLTVIASLEKSLRSGGAMAFDTTTTGKLQAARDQLNSWSSAIHESIGETGRSPYLIMGTVSHLRASGIRTLDERLEDALTWNADQIQAAEDTIDNAAVAISALGCPPKDHPWSGTEGSRATPFDIDRIRRMIEAGLANGRALLTEISVANETIGARDQYSPATVSRLVSALRMLVRVPETGRSLLVHEAWRSEQARIAAIVAAGQICAKHGPSLDAIVDKTAWVSEPDP